MDFTRLTQQAYKIIGRGEKLRPESINDAVYALERMLNSWVNRGVTTWRLATRQVTLADDSTSVTLTGGNVFGVVAGKVLDGTDAYDLRFVSRQRFEKYQHTDDVGRPTHAVFYANSRDTDPVVEFYPKTNKATFILELRTLLFLPDPTLDLSYPVSWDNAILYGLAVELGYMNSIPMDVLTGVVEKFKFEFTKAKGADREVETSCFVDPVF